MNEVIIRIIDTANNVEGDLELANFNDFPLAITKGIVNLDNLKDRTGTYTKTFKVPNTKNNANLLSSVDNINSRKDYRDALNRKPCIILVNDNPIEKGFVQVSKVYNGFDLDSFELVFFGNNIDWVKDAAELKLNSITWANNTQTYDITGINTANAQSSDNYDHAYPYISRGGNEAIPNTEVRDYYPVFYLRSIITKGFNHLGYNSSSSFLSDANFKKLVCDLNPLFILPDSDINDSISRAERTTPSTTNLSPGVYSRIIFDDDSTAPNNDLNGNFNTSTGIYTVPQSGRYNINVFIKSFNRNTNVNNGARLIVVKNGETISSLGTGEELADESLFIPGQLGTNSGDRLVQYDVLLTQGDSISIYINAGSTNTQTISYGNGTYCSFRIKSEISEGDTYGLNSIIPKEIKLLDVLNDFTRMFNIYYWTDIKTKTVYFEPRDTFFKAQTEAIEWTDKLDISNKYELDYVSSYKRNIEFSYRDVNNDEYLKEWQKVNKRNYAQYIHTLPDRFAEGTTKIQLELFSASYAHVATEATPLDSGVSNSNLAFTSLLYWNEFLTDGSIPTERISSYNPRIFFFNNATQTSDNGVSRLISNVDGTSSTTIPYGIFETYNNTDTVQNLSFTNGTKTDGSLDKGLFDTYYSKMLKNIEEGGRLIAYFNLNSTDIENLDFRKLIYLDNDYDVRGYYLIESVIDYKPVQNGLTKVSLFKFENLGSVSIDSSQEGNNSEDADEGNAPPTLQPIYVEDGAQLIEVYIENPITGILEPVYK
jgi:hypothetical protein